MDRIEANPRATSSRLARSYVATDRYTDNIMRMSRFRNGGSGAYDIRFSRNTYMGLSNG